MGNCRHSISTSHNFQISTFQGARMPVMDRFKLNGKTALVTGGARGLGKTMATALAEAGADIALTGRSREACDAAAKEIGEATGRTVRAFAGDVTVAADVAKLH